MLAVADSTHKFRLVDHGGDNELGAPETLVEGAAMKLGLGLGLQGVAVAHRRGGLGGDDTGRGHTALVSHLGATAGNFPMDGASARTDCVTLKQWRPSSSETTCVLKGGRKSPAESRRGHAMRQVNLFFRFWSRSLFGFQGIGTVVIDGLDLGKLQVALHSGHKAACTQ